MYNMFKTYESSSFFFCISIKNAIHIILLLLLRDMSHKLLIIRKIYYFNNDNYVSTVNQLECHECYVVLVKIHNVYRKYDVKINVIIISIVICESNIFTVFTIFKYTNNVAIKTKAF